MKRKLAALFAILITLTCVPLSGCSDNDDSSSSDSSSSDESATEEATTEAPDPSLTVDGESVDTSSIIMCTIDGNEVSFDEFRYCYYYVYSSYASSLGVTEDEMAEYDDDERKTHFDALIAKVVSFLQSKYAYLNYAKANDITLTDDEKQSCEDYITSLKEEQGDDYESYLKQNYVTESYLSTLVEQTTLAAKVSQSFEVSDDDFLEIAENELYQVKSILVPFGYDLTPSDGLLEQLEIDDFDSLSNSQKMNVLPVTFSALDDDEQEEQKEKAKEYVEEIRQKALDGDDFDELISEYGYDGGMTGSFSGGYVIGDFYTDYDEDYVDAACSLEVGGISEIVETTYGYQIIKRVEIDTDYIKENITEDESDDSDDSDSDSSSSSSSEDVTFKEEYETMVEYKTMNEILPDITVEKSDYLNNLEYGDLT